MKYILKKPIEGIDYMNQLEQIKKESQDEFEKECGLVDMQYRSESDKALDCIARLVEKAYQAGQEAERVKFVTDTQKLADSVPPNLLLNEIVNKYWQPCEHDYSIVLLSNPPQYQCKKCNQIKR